MLQTPPLDSDSGLVSVEAIIDEIAGFLGSPDDPDVWNAAARMIDRVADRMNMAGTYLTKLSEHVPSLVSDASTVDLPTDWGWPYGNAYVRDTTNDQTKSLINWVDWERFRSMQDQASTVYYPEFCSLRSELDGVIYLYPHINSQVVANYQLVFPYYARIPRPSEVTELNVSQEIREALLTGGEAFAMRRRYKDKPQIWKPYWDDFTAAVRLAKAASTRRQAAQHGRARVASAPWQWPIGR